MKRPSVHLLLAVLLMVPAVAAAQTPGSSGHESRIFVDVNVLGVASSLAHEREFTSQFLKFGEVASTRATYPKPSRANLFPLDVGGGVMLRRWLGIGVVYSRTTFEDGVGLTATIPHPMFLNAPATGTGVSDGALSRKEAATHVFLAWVPVRTTRATLRFYGGPSFYSYAADMVNEVTYTQTFDPVTPQQTVTITGFTSQQARGNGLGYHFGGDVAYFVAKRFAVTGGVRFGWGEITLEPEPLSQLSQDIRVGSTLVVLGVRVHFGG